jgi:formylglycine-generating enzyme required for sulfatase activity
VPARKPEGGAEGLVCGMMGVMSRRAILITFVLLIACVSGAWAVFDLPPPRLLFKYGLPPVGGPTGKTLEREGLTFIELSPGYYRMGSHALCEKGDLLGIVGSFLGFEWGTPPEHDRTECPRRWVEIPEPFFIATTEVPNEVFERFIDEHERCDYSLKDRHPAVRVSWWTANRFCDRFTEYIWKTGQLCRLPTEEEWEYACRAGTTSRYFFGEDPGRLATYAAARPDGPPFPEGGKPRLVAGLLPNPWGLFDITGNVWEWCANDGPTSEVRIFRGGGCRSGPEDCRCATRRWTVPGRRIAFLGLRPVLVAAPDES